MNDIKIVKENDTLYRLSYNQIYWIKNHMGVLSDWQIISRFFHTESRNVDRVISEIRMGKIKCE